MVPCCLEVASLQRVMPVTDKSFFFSKGAHARNVPNTCTSMLFLLVYAITDWADGGNLVTKLSLMNIREMVPITVPSKVPYITNLYDEAHLVFALVET